MKRLYLFLLLITVVALSACDDGDAILSGESVQDESAVTDITIDSVSPASVEIGKPVTIGGTGFNLSKDKVIIGNIEMAPDGAEGAADSNDGTKIVFTVPAEVPIGDVELKVKRSDEIESNVVNIKIVPTVNNDAAKVPKPDADEDDQPADDNEEIKQAELTLKRVGDATDTYSTDNSIYTYEVEWKLPEGITEAVLYAPYYQTQADCCDTAIPASEKTKVTNAIDAYFSEKDLLDFDAVNYWDAYRDAFEKCYEKPSTRHDTIPLTCKPMKVTTNEGKFKVIDVDLHTDLCGGSFGACVFKNAVIKYKDSANHEQSKKSTNQL